MPNNSARAASLRNLPNLSIVTQQCLDFIISCPQDDPRDTALLDRIEREHKEEQP